MAVSPQASQMKEMLRQRVTATPRHQDHMSVSPHCRQDTDIYTAKYFQPTGNFV